jgi:hypothetical protein
MNPLYAIGQHAIALIRKQAEQGVDIDGKRYEYSTKPYAMPLQPRLRKFSKTDRLGIFKTNSGKLWAVVRGGYRDYRAMAGRATDSDFLDFSGAMLRSIDTLRTEKTTTGEQIVIGFRDVEQARKAFWLNVSGAGKSRKLWKFLGLTPQNQEALARFAEQELLKSMVIQEDIIRSVRESIKSPTA